MKVGPTVRIGLSPAGAAESAAGVVAAAAGGAAVALPAGAAPFLAAVPFAGCGCARCCIFFALSSVTMMSPCCSTAALSSTDFSASDQVWPAALQAQDGLNSVRNLNAVRGAV